MTTMERKKCYLCDCEEFSLMDGMVRDNSELKLTKCVNCGFISLNSFSHISKEFYKGGHMRGTLDASGWEEKSLVDDRRRFIFLKKSLQDKKILDFGCGAGGFLKMATTCSKNAYGIELDEIQRRYLVKNNLNVFETLAETPDELDIITMFHVLEHLENPIEVLMTMKEKLKDNNSEIIIEVPNSNDALLTLYKSKAFNRFTWWSCHLYSYNIKNITQLIEKAGFKLNYVKKIQRYGIFNHLYWLLKGKPRGHEKFKAYSVSLFEFLYEKFLALLNKTDTILISISKK